MLNKGGEACFAIVVGLLHRELRQLALIEATILQHCLAACPIASVPSTMSSAFPKTLWVGFPRVSHESRLLVGWSFEAADIS